VAPAIIWFRRDLRLGDHPALVEAVRRGGADGVLPLFILDDALLAPAGAPRAAFLADTLGALEGAMGAQLCLRAGDPVEVLAGLVAETGATDVLVTADHGPYGRRRDDAVARALERLGARLVPWGSNYVVEPGTIRSAAGTGFQVFGAFRRRWELLGPFPILAEPEVRWLEAPSTASLNELVARASTRVPARFGALAPPKLAELPTAGEAAARARLERFAEAGAGRYEVGRDELARDGSSKLSWHLRFGSLHPRTALAVVSGDGEGARAFRSELAWREFYADVLFHHPDAARRSLRVPMRQLRVDHGALAEERFAAWALGRTGIPLVDAAMRQLLETGWMHNRGRMVVASFLVKHLHLDWRWGARWFMWRLVDGDLASNSQGWQWTAGTGTDAAPFHRIFSPLAQAARFDPAADYIHRWVPELTAVAPPAAFSPGGGEGLLRPVGYPGPIVDLAAERAEALARFREVRGRADAP
jgi:deoxyribodipyrimidine photo-lyase